MENTEIKDLMIALGKFQEQCPPITLDDEVKVKTGNGSYGFKFASMKHIVDKTKKPLVDNKLVYTFTVNTDGTVNCILCHTESGQLLTSSLRVTKDGQKAQEVGSAITYSKRYLLSAMLGIVADEDDDGNSADGNAITNKKDYVAPTKEEKVEKSLASKDEQGSKLFDTPPVQRTVMGAEAKSKWDGIIIDGKYIMIGDEKVEPDPGQIEKLKGLPQYKK